MADFEQLNSSRSAIEDLLAPYGTYLVAKESPGRMPLAFASLGIAALALLGFAAKAYFESLLSELGKVHAKRLDPLSTDDKEQAEVAEAVDRMVIEVRVLRESAPGANGPEVDPAALVAELVALGLSQRAAKRAAESLSPELESQIERLTRT